MKGKGMKGSLPHPKGSKVKGTRLPGGGRPKGKGK
jgi:hypothetical protein